MTDKTTEQQAGEVRELLDELLSGGGRRGAFDGALLVLSRALSPEAEDFGTLITGPSTPSARPLCFVAVSRTATP